MRSSLKSSLKVSLVSLMLIFSLTPVSYAHLHRESYYHGGIYQKANFDDVLTAVVNFLKKHPSETVLMRVKQERTDQPGRFFEIFRDKYWNHPNYKDYMWNIPTRSQNPTLGEMRGKIVILQDFARWQCESPDSKAEFGLCYNDHTFVIQDSFRLGTND